MPWGRSTRLWVIKDLDAADAAAVEASFIGDGAHDVSGLHAIAPAHLDAEALHAGFRRAGLLAGAAAQLAAGAGPLLAAAIAAVAGIAAAAVLANPALIALHQQGLGAHRQLQGGQGELLGAGAAFPGPPAAGSRKAAPAPPRGLRCSGRRRGVGAADRDGFWLMVALLGISMASIGRPTARSSPPRKRRSRGVTNRIASPVRPARPVRPMRCT